MTKFCPECNIIKSINDFYNDKVIKDKKQRKCKNCSKIYALQWQKDNPMAKKRIDAKDYLKNKYRKTNQAKRRYYYITDIKL